MNRKATEVYVWWVHGNDDSWLWSCSQNRESFIQV